MRYAIYFTPPEGDRLAVAASAWLGRDPGSIFPVGETEADGFSAAEISALTAEPRRYGFHATLKAPFELADNADEDALLSAFDAFAEAMSAIEINSLSLGQLGSFFALVPGQWSNELEAFAAECVRHFEPFRAPISAADIQRRKPDTLSASQLHNLETWGYPYVFEDFRFHMTLTGQVPAEAQDAVRSALEARFASFIGKPLDISHLALFAEPERGAPFYLKRIKPLRAAREKRTA
ncbi:DUF1045 domain-containing protein [Rhizobium sp. KVB221]|uniref:DUF1045 domain-containing protein n=1 Tax=Rhizobium setariae TaxID=2801340 RepID=A0A936YQY0_9HYPH|nr:DUF1045 domain-containing protein [Rhizobium setariae]MBL0372926.1 DUF1045 domain-containing protein [Rhizobium setariae]